MFNYSYENLKYPHTTRLIQYDVFRQVCCADCNQERCHVNRGRFGSFQSQVGASQFVTDTIRTFTFLSTLNMN